MIRNALQRGHKCLSSDDFREMLKEIENKMCAFVFVEEGVGVDRHSDISPVASQTCVACLSDCCWTHSHSACTVFTFKAWCR